MPALHALPPAPPAAVRSFHAPPAAAVLEVPGLPSALAAPLALPSLAQLPAPGLLAAPEDGLDRTDRFLEAHAAADRPAATSARDRRFLVIPGFMWDFIPGAYRGNLAALADLGLDAEFVPVDSMGSSARNAVAVADAIARSPKPVVLIGHSKGGLDAFAALDLRPELAAKLDAVVTVQTPYRGSPAAAALRGRPNVRVALQAATRLARKGPKALPTLLDDPLRDIMRTTRRGRPEGPRLVSIATSIGDDPRAAILPLRAADWAMRAWTGKKTDGLVPEDDAVVPGSEVVRLKGITHAEFIFGSGALRKLLGATMPAASDAYRLTRAIVHFLFPK